jgi:hypothetical protein
MPEFDKATKKKPDVIEQKHHFSQNNSKTLAKQFQDGRQHSLPAGDTPLQPPIMTHLQMLSEAISVEERAKLMSHLQQSYGNRYVLRLLNSRTLQAKLTVSTPGDASELEANQIADNIMQTETVPEEKLQDIQHIDLEGETEDIYEGVPEAINTALEPSLEVPDLTQDTHDKAKAAIERGEYQLAIDFILSEVQASKMPDLYKCQPPTVKYDAALTAYAGLCSCKYDPETNKAKSIWVTVGNGAFTTVAFLYSTMMHEYEHVLQWFADPKGVAGNIPMAEFDTYTWEIYHAEETGIANLPGTLKSRGKWLKSEAWDKMTPQEQEQNSITYYWALQIIRDATGDQSWEP